MAYSKVFSRRNWENEPSTATPLNETNLNVGDNALDIIDDRVVALDARATALEGYEPRVIEYAQQAETSKQNSEAYAVGKRDGVDVTSGDPTYHNNSKYYSEQAGASATTSITNKQNAEAYAVGQRDGVDVTSGDVAYHNNAKYYSEQASASATSSDSRAEDSEAWAVGKRDGTDVGSSDATYHNNSKYYSEQSASQVANSEAWANGQRNGVDVGSSDPAYHNNSKYFKEIADTRATASDVSATEAESYAHGGTNSRQGEDTDNANYYRGLAQTSATNASTSESNSEAWAVGQRGGVDVQQTDDTYHNNAKYYSELAHTSEQNAATSEQNALTSETNADERAEDSEAWAVGKRKGVDVPSTDETYRNNAKFWAEQAEASSQIGVMEGATDSASGKSGLVPQPLAGDNKKALFGDGTFKRVLYESKTGTLLSSEWTYANDVYTQSITISGVTADTVGIVGLPLNISAIAKEMAGDVGLKLKSQSTNTLTFEATEEPTENIPIVLNM